MNWAAWLLYVWFIAGGVMALIGGVINAPASDKALEREVHMARAAARTSEYFAVVLLLYISGVRP